MLSSLMKEHQARKASFRESNEKLRREASDAVADLTVAFMDSINRGVVEVYMNQHQLENEARALQTQATQFAKLSAQWVSMYASFNTALKELGDFENWCKVIEDDAHAIASVLEHCSKAATDRQHMY